MFNKSTEKGNTKGLTGLISKERKKKGYKVWIFFFSWLLKPLHFSPLL